MKGEKFILRIIVSAVAIAVMLIHISNPRIKIDAISLGLLLLACMPWLASIIKSIELPGVGKVEFQELKETVQKVVGDTREAKVDAKEAKGTAQEAKGAALSTANTLYFELAGTTTENPLKQNETNIHQTSPDKINELAEQYNKIRKDQKPGTDRTIAMTKVMREMVNLVPTLHGYNVTAALNSFDKGKRLTGYAYLFGKPDSPRLHDLVNCITTIEDTPFGQYWGLQALEKIISLTPLKEINETSVTDNLKEFYKKLQPGSDRHYVLGRILGSLAKRRD
ncbi:MAG: hypothetical protein ABIO55_11090 [Ginsengibacter sp.]